MFSTPTLRASEIVYKTSLNEDEMRKSERTFKKVVDAIELSILTEGERGTTFKSVANLAGVSQACVVKYVPSQKQMLTTVLRVRMEQFKFSISRVDDSLSESEIRHRILNICNEFLLRNERPSCIVLGLFKAKAHEDYRRLMLPFLEVANNLDQSSEAHQSSSVVCLIGRLLL
jgi:predicted transcriptional regulator